MANVLSAQKDNKNHFTWVNFQPEFHTHLVQCAQVLLPPLSPTAKGKKVKFVFILEILDGGITGSFWTPLKKCCHQSSVLKKPEVTAVTKVPALQEAPG